VSKKKEEKSPLAVLVEFANATAEETFKMGEHLPVWLLETEEDIQIVATPFGSYREKEAVAFFLRNVIPHLGVIRFAFITEAWTYSARADEVDIVNPTLPSEHPDREECVFIIGEDTNGEDMFLARMIIREPGKPPRLAAPEKLDQMTNVLSGVFDNLLGRPRVAQ
jgi:hypothetical protein